MLLPMLLSISAFEPASIVARWRVNLRERKVENASSRPINSLTAGLQKSTTTFSFPQAPFTALAQTASYLKSAPHHTSLPSSSGIGVVLASTTARDPST